MTAAAALVNFAKILSVPRIPIPYLPLSMIATMSPEDNLNNISVMDTWVDRKHLAIIEELEDILNKALMDSTDPQVVAEATELLSELNAIRRRINNHQA
jgi:hypothetical protein